MSKSSDLQILLKEFIKEVPDLLTVLVVDFNGFIIEKTSVKKFDDELIGGITTILDQTLNRIKGFTQSELGSGSFDIDQFRLFYIQLGKITGAMLVLIGDPFSNLDKYIPYAHILADKVSLILSNHNVSCRFPSVSEDGNIKLEESSKSIVIIGSKAVGKTTLARMFCDGTFIEDYHPTIGVSVIEKDLDPSNDTQENLNIFDLSSLNNYAKVRRFFYNYSDALFLMFDYSRRETLNDIEGWIEEARQFVRGSLIPLVLIGNKIDVDDEIDAVKRLALEIANKYDCKFFEISILTGEGIYDLFESMRHGEFFRKEEKVIAQPISSEFLKNLTEDERIVFISNIDIESLDESKIPNVLEKNIIKIIAKFNEISLAILMDKIAPLEKALNRKIDRNIIIKITDKYLQKGMINRQILKFDNDLDEVEGSKVLNKGDI